MNALQQHIKVAHESKNTFNHKTKAPILANATRASRSRVGKRLRNGKPIIWILINFLANYSATSQLAT